MFLKNWLTRHMNDFENSPREARAWFAHALCVVRPSTVAEGVGILLFVLKGCGEKQP